MSGHTTPGGLPQVSSWTQRSCAWVRPVLLLCSWPLRSPCIPDLMVCGVPRAGQHLLGEVEP